MEERIKGKMGIKRKLENNGEKNGRIKLEEGHQGLIALIK